MEEHRGIISMARAQQAGRDAVAVLECISEPSWRQLTNSTALLGRILHKSSAARWITRVTPTMVRSTAARRKSAEHLAHRSGELRQGGAK